jgi:hypothetical protein
MKRLSRSRLTVAAGLIAFALAAPAATAAHASAGSDVSVAILSSLCDAESTSECWYNNGDGMLILTNSSGGSGWALEAATGVTWDNRSMSYIVAGDGSCAEDIGGNNVALMESNYQCTNPDILSPNDYFYYDASTGAIVSEYATGQAGHFECLYAGGGNVGTFPCPSKPPMPENAKWTF